MIDQSTSLNAENDTEETFRLLFASNPHPMWVFDTETLKFLEVNDAAVASYGYSRDQFVNMRITDIRPKADVPNLLDVVASARPDLNPAGEWRHKRKDGQVIDVEIVSHSLTFNDRPARLVVAQDISQRKAAEAELAARAEQFAVIADLGLQALSGESLKRLMDEAARHIATVLDVESVKLVQQPPDDASLHDHNAAGDVTVTIPGSEGPFGVLIAHSAHPRSFGQHEISFLQSVANVLATAIERRQAENEVRRLNAQLEERVRQRTAQLEVANNELEAFAYSVSHDLRAPLRAMDGFSRILLRNFADDLPDQAQHYLERVRHSAQQMDLLIRDLLAFSRLSRQPLEKRLVDSETLVRELLDELAPEREERTVEVAIHPLPPVEADASLLRSVFANLLSNALKYTRARTAAHVEIGAREQDGDPVFYIKDNGIGFDMRYADKIFGVFQRLHRPEEYEGTGVGLATVQRIVHRHGGRVWVETEPNQGATFYFTLGGNG